MIFLNLQDRVLENRSPGAPGWIIGKQLGKQVELEPGSQGGMNTHGLPGTICSCLLCSDPGYSSPAGSRSVLWIIQPKRGLQCETG